MLNKHFQDFLGLLEKHNVEYVIVGGYAVGVHGFPRYTGDMDVFVGISVENARRLVDVFNEFGFESLGLKASDFLEPDTGGRGWKGAHENPGPHRDRWSYL